MSQLQKLNFPSIRLRARRNAAGKVEVWNELRNQYLVLTPEEWVRRHLVSYLIHSCHVPPQRIVEEYAVRLNSQPQRADVVVVDSEGRPLAVAECKAPEVAISEQTLSQAVRYNSVLGARYLLLTNGLRHYCWEKTPTGYVPRQHFPTF